MSHVSICAFAGTHACTHSHTHTHAYTPRSLRTELDQDDEERKPSPQKKMQTPAQNKERADAQDMTLSEWKQAFGDVIDSTILR